MVVSLVGRGSDGRVLPENLAGGAIDGENFEAMFLVGATATARATATGLRRRRSFARLPGRNCRRHEEAVAPGHRRRVTPSGDLDLPLHVGGVAPRDRRLARSDTGMSGTAPVRP